MNNLPTSLNRVELYLATAAQMPGVTPPEEPLSRLEQYLAFIAGDTSVELPAPASLCEQWLAYVAGITPAEPLKLEGAFHVGVQKVDVRFFAVAAGMPGVVAPEPQNRTEQYWAKLAEILPVHGVLKYATGTNITLTDVAWWKMGLERINGDTTQQTYTGKNLMPVQAGTASNYGLTVTVTDDGKITINGTTTTGVLVKVTNGVGISVGDQIDASWFQQSIVSDLNGDTISIRYVSGTYQDSGVAWRIFKDTAPYLYQWYPNNSILQQSFTSSTVATTFFALYAQTGKTFNNYTVQVQLETGDTATDFEPYVGGVPAPNPNYPQAINTVTGEQTVTILGKNLLKITEPSSTVADVTFTMNEDGTITLNGTATAASWKNIARDFVSPQMTISNIGVETKSQTVDGWTFSASISNGELQSAVHGSDNGWWAVRLKVGETYNNAILKLQLEQGTPSTEWQPYQEQSYLVGLYGKNMFNKAEAITYKWLNSNTGKLQDSSDPNVVTPYIRVEVGKTYTFSGIGNLQIRVFGYANLTDNKLVTYINNVRDQRTFTAQYPYMRASIGGGDAVAVLDAIQCEQGDTATSFEAYTPVELCKIGTYQDYIYKSGDDWYIKKTTSKYMFTGNETVGKSGKTSNNSYYYASSQNPDYGFSDIDKTNMTSGDSSSVVIPTYCQYFVASSSNTVTGSDSIGLSFNLGGSNGLDCRFGVGLTSTINTAALFKTWLGENSPTVYYPLATPTETKITNQALISQLNALDRAALPQPVAYLSVDGDLPGELQISYYGEEE